MQTQAVVFVHHLLSDELNFCRRQGNVDATATVWRVGFAVKQAAATGAFGGGVFGTSHKIKTKFGDIFI